MRQLSPFELALAGTLAAHIIIITAADALVVTHPPRIPEPAPHVELVNIEVPPEKPAPPPPPAPDVPPPPVPHTAPPPPTRVAPRAIRQTQPVAPETPPPVAPPTPTTDEGGAPVVSMPDVAPGATGVAVAKGPVNSGRVGRSGAGGSTGAGTGSGAGDVPAPMSVATIKTRALPKGDYGFFDAGKEYPAEAKTLGIEGAIRVRLVVGVDGTVKAASLLNHLGHGLDELALSRAQQIQFTPAKDTSDQPVTSVVIWTFHMELPK
ncbi:MAG TPA: TonB family protein [Kofleriaceae bacterium]